MLIVYHGPRQMTRRIYIISREELYDLCIRLRDEVAALMPETHVEASYGSIIDTDIVRLTFQIEHKRVE